MVCCPLKINYFTPGARRRGVGGECIEIPVEQAGSAAGWRKEGQGATSQRQVG